MTTTTTKYAAGRIPLGHMEVCMSGGTARLIDPTTGADVTTAAMARRIANGRRERDAALARVRARQERRTMTATTRRPARGTTATLKASGDPEADWLKHAEVRKAWTRQVGERLARTAFLRFARGRMHRGRDYITDSLA